MAKKFNKANFKRELGKSCTSLIQPGEMVIGYLKGAEPEWLKYGMQKGYLYREESKTDTRYYNYFLTVEGLAIAKTLPERCITGRRIK